MTHVKAESQSTRNLNGGGNTEVGSQVEEVYRIISDQVSIDQHACGEVEVVNEPIDPNFSSTALQDSAEGRAPEGGSIPSTEKHLVSVEVKFS